MNSFLLTFDTERVDRNAFLRELDLIDDVTNWYAFFPGSVAIVSGVETKVLSRQIRDRLPSSPFLLTPIQDGNRAGFLPRSVWEFIKDPRPVERLAS